MAKRQKYNNGSLVARKDFKGIGSIEGNLAGNQNFQQASVAGTVKKGDTSFTANLYKDSMGNKATNYSLEKQLKNQSSIGLKVRKSPEIEYNKKIGGGFNLKITAGKRGGVMSISKPL